MAGRIMIAADLVPTKPNNKLFETGNTSQLIGEKLERRLQNADLIVMNLETPLCDDLSPIRKCCPCLNAPTETIEGIKKINPCFFTLANNHIMDQGINGLKSTMSVLDKAGIRYAGVGANRREASKPFITSIEDKRIGFYCCAEHEFSIATDDSPGANPYDPLVSFDDVRELREKCDYLLVLYHGGKEHYRYPSPMLQRVFHKFADMGADLVVAQHTHCIGSMEEYNGSTLVYGQGNFLFDYSNSEFWKTPLLIEIDLESKDVSFIPLVKDEDKVREAEGEDAIIILNEFNARSAEITKPGFVEKKYSEFADEMETEYLTRFAGGFSKNIFVRVINKLTSYRFIKRFYSDRFRVIIENVLDCEAHRELASKALRGR